MQPWGLKILHYIIKTVVPVILIIRYDDIECILEITITYLLRDLFRRKTADIYNTIHQLSP